VPGAEQPAPAPAPAATQQHAASTSASAEQLKPSIEIFADNEEDDFVDETSLEGQDVSGRRARGVRRECPVPKPGGIIGETLGFKSARSGGRKADTNSEQPP